MSVADVRPSDEQTPLLQTVRVAPARPRYPHSILRRFCTIALASSVFLVVVLFLLPVALLPWRHGRHAGAPPPFGPWNPFLPHGSWPDSNGLPKTELDHVLRSTANEENIRAWSQYYTAGPHLAGKNLSQAQWTSERWKEFGVRDTHIVPYDVYINYPAGHRLALMKHAAANSSNSRDVADSPDAWTVSFEAKLEEDVLKEDGTSQLDDRVPTFHGYSASGNVTAAYVYVNYGTFEDFEDLQAANVSLEGKIALARYGRIFRGLKVKRAQELGMVGMVIYTDPGDDGNVTEANGHAPYPDGPAREPSSVQRGSVQYLSIAPGDPTTPGYPSKPGVPRQDTSTVIPSIPSLPISYLDAVPLLQALNGHGRKASSFNKWWQGGGLAHKGVAYNIGPSPDHTALHLVNEQEYVTNPLWNVIGIINGTIADEVVILGNHRDAWIAGGAGDPNSGSAALMEVVRTFGRARAKGWKPLRTIVFCSWDGEEYGLIGSTEWVEEYLPWLSSSAVVYLNVDVGTSGPSFKAAAAPLLDQAVEALTSSVLSPNQTRKGQTVRDLWSGNISTIGSGSDFTAFQDFAGVPCIDMGFTPDEDSAVYHYHSNYDSFDWMDRYGDSGWHYHVAMAKMWALLATSFIERPVLPFNATNYADALLAYLQKGASDATSTPASGLLSSLQDDYDAIEHAISHLRTAASELDATSVQLSAHLRRNIPWYQPWKRVHLYRASREVNRKYKLLERQFLYAPGLDGRNWFKHSVFAPGLWTGYAGVTFPGLVEAREEGDMARFT
ncbi:MAG: hypothetical protein M1838_005174, partial [Thelocarpon superellum]